MTTELEQPCEDLFDKIVSRVRHEHEYLHSKKIITAFTGLLLVSAGLLPFSFLSLVDTWIASGSWYFISAAFMSPILFFDVWQDFILSILESLPVFNIIVFLLNLAVFIFSVNIFLYKKGMLVKFLFHGTAK